jgi:sugar fermentation stimulation protein A
MLLPNLIKAQLLRRYKRFLVDVRLVGGEEVTVHLANPGSMLGLLVPEGTVYLSRSANSKNKLAYSLKIVELPQTLVVVDTLLANKLFAEFLTSRLLPELAVYQGFLREQGFEDSRFDFLLSSDLGSAYLELKSSTLAFPDSPRALFPDAKTARGLKHLEALVRAKASGLEAIQYYLVMRSDCQEFASCPGIDSSYAAKLKEVSGQGVKLFARDLQFHWRDKSSAEFPSLELNLGKKLPVYLD